MMDSQNLEFPPLFYESLLVVSPLSLFLQKPNKLLLKQFFHFQNLNPARGNQFDNSFQVQKIQKLGYFPLPSA